jgi:hypothetical protein
MKKKRPSKIVSVLAMSALQKHFGKTPIAEVVTASRTFPMTSRVDVQIALETVRQEEEGGRLLGCHADFTFQTVTFANMVAKSHSPVVISPLQYQEVDVGEAMPARYLRQALWLSKKKTTPFALLMSTAMSHGRESGVHVEIALPAGENGAEISRSLLDRIEALVRKTSSYKGKVISLEVADDYSGRSGPVRVHKLRGVSRDEVILPESTVRLLDRNITEFIKTRDRLQKLGMPIKKGLLFYGPPGTGKTHTVHYLASQLPDHTTLLITSEQVALLDHYFQLARFLQPAMIVIEDVDLIARAREKMYGPCDESLLNKLLNEMDGLRADAAILFILTTNRPEQLEAALASRPGRVDQAIEFPLPNERGRRQLVKLYACGLPVAESIVDVIVRRTEGASAAFIKELMRRSAQYYLEAGGNGGLKAEFLDAALEEMLFSGGSLNVKLLGGSAKSSAVN